MAIYSYGVCGRYSPSLYRHTATTRPLHPLEPFWARVCSRPAENTEDWLEDIGKWTIKRAAGRQVPRPTMRDFLSRGMTARFDTTEAKRALAWTPEADIERFWRAAVDVHAD